MLIWFEVINGEINALLGKRNTQIDAHILRLGVNHVWVKI